MKSNRKNKLHYYLRIEILPLSWQTNTDEQNSEVGEINKNS